MKNHFKLKGFFFFLTVSLLLFSCSNEETPEAQEELTSVALNADLGTKFQLGTNGNLVLEHSWDTDGCGDGSCNTDLYEEDLDDIVGIENGPSESYFYENSASKHLNLKCQKDDGRRAEFKQKSNGSLNSDSSMDFWAVYYDIPDDGVTIAQVHNRGGSTNKPFFRLVLHEDKLETVIRKDPEVSFDDTSFKRADFSLGEDYDGRAIRVIIKKGDNGVRIRAKYKGTWILDQTYAPESSTRWVTNSGIASGYYLKAGVYNDSGPHTEDLRAKFTTFKFDTDD